MIRFENLTGERKKEEETQVRNVCKHKSVRFLKQQQFRDKRNLLKTYGANSAAKIPSLAIQLRMANRTKDISTVEVINVKVCF